MSLLLSDEEVKQLTGAERPSRQIDMLRTNGIRFYIKATGYPAVPRAQFESNDDSRASKPNFQALKKTG